MTRRWTSTAQSVARMAVTVPNPEERGRRCVVGRDAIYAFREGGDEEEEWEAHGAIVGVKGTPTIQVPRCF